MLRSPKIIFSKRKLEERIESTLAYYRGGADNYREGAGTRFERAEARS